MYRLHIDAPHIPITMTAREPAHKQSLRKAHAQKSAPIAANQVGSRRIGVGAFIWDKIQFLGVSAVMFVIIYVVLNWQALYINAVHYFNVWQGIESPLERLVADETVSVPERLMPLYASDVAGRSPIAPLNFELYPPDTRLIIPRINQNVPVIGVKNENLISRKWDELESDIQNALRSGVIHYPGTSLPGDNGNTVITGHSSYYAWDPGRFKDVFALLHDVRVGDKMVMYFNQRKYVYEVESKKVVLPQDVNVLGPAPREQLTLITCTPIGTNLKRLILTAKLVGKS